MLGQVEISKTPPAWVLGLYRNPESIKTRNVHGVYDPETGRMWAASEEEALHEIGHNKWHKDLSEQDREQWKKWFQEGFFVSSNSKIDESEFFAEHFRYYSLGKVFVQRPDFSGGGFNTSYAEAFPTQFQWFQGAGANLLVARYKK
jgi:hypothetical protein